MKNKSHEYVIEQCPDCDVLNRIPAHPPHKRAICGICKAELPDPYRIEINQLDFELLPPGKWEISDVIAYYKEESRRFSKELRNLNFQHYRLLAINKLNPCECYVGKETWLGYIAFRFKGCSKTVLECPFEGNATYILSGNWKNLIRHSKKEIREIYSHHYTKVVHRGDWIKRIKNALKDR